MSLGLRDQRGIALVMSLAVLFVLMIAAASLLSYSGAQLRHSSYDRSAQAAYALAEAGINEAAAVLHNPANNALNASLLAPQTSSYDGGTVTRSGVFDPSQAEWTITSTGTVANPTGGGASPITRTLSAKVTVTPVLTGVLNSQAWNYIYDWGTGEICDMTLQQSVEVDSPLYVEGNLCLQNTATIVSGPLVVKGRLTLAQNANSVGSATSPINEAHIGNGCKYQNNPLHVPCSGAPDNVFAQTLDSSPTAIQPPMIDWDGWYQNASPGPRFACYEPNSSPPSSWPTFDTNQARDNSVASAWNLAPTGSYDCWTEGGRLKWDATAKQLTVSGTIFIDGSAYIENGSVNTYTGQATLYLSGTFLLKNSSLCAVATGDGSACDTASWNPNTRLLIVVADGNGDNGLPTGDSIQLVSATLQGGLFGTNTIETTTSSVVVGPIVAKTIVLGQSATASFPFITIVPSGAPGNPNVYAQPSAPSSYSG